MSKKQSAFSLQTIALIALALILIVGVVFFLSLPVDDGSTNALKIKQKCISYIHNGDSLLQLGKHEAAAKTYKNAQKYCEEESQKTYLGQQLVTCEKGALIFFNKSFGGIDQDYGNALLQTPDGGYIIAGSSHSNKQGDANIYLVRTDHSGELLWEKTYGDAGNDYAKDILPTRDGGFLLVGYTNSFKTDKEDDDGWIIKIDNKGNKEWEQNFGGHQKDRLLSATITKKKKGFALVGFTKSKGRGKTDVWVIRLDEDGSELWNRTYGSQRTEIGFDILENKHGEFMAVGRSQTKDGDTDAWVIKLKENGDLIWEKHFGGSKPDVATCITQTDNDKYIISGYTKTYSTVPDVEGIWIIKMNRKGREEWRQSVGNSDVDIAKSIISNSDGTFSIAAHTSSYGQGSSDMWLLNVGANGSVFWHKEFGGQQTDGANDVIQTADGGYAIVGFTTINNNMNMTLTKVNPKGALSPNRSQP